MRSSRKVIDADYSDSDGVTLTLECRHKVWVAGFPRSQIPPCFRFGCLESPCYQPEIAMGDEH